MAALAVLLRTPSIPPVVLDADGATGDEGLVVPSVGHLVALALLLATSPRGLVEAGVVCLRLDLALGKLGDSAVIAVVRFPLQHGQAGQALRGPRRGSPLHDLLVGGWVGSDPCPVCVVPKQLCVIV